MFVSTDKSSRPISLDAYHHTSLSTAEFHFQCLHVNKNHHEWRIWKWWVNTTCSLTNDVINVNVRVCTMMLWCETVEPIMYYSLMCMGRGSYCWWWWQWRQVFRHLHLRLLDFVRPTSITKILQVHCRLSFFIAGLRITSDVLIGKSTWDVLFQPPNFFSKYKYMISPFFVCLNVTLSISSSGLYYKLNVPLKVDAIKIYFGSVVFYWLSFCVNNSFKYSRWKKQIQQFTCKGNILIQILGHFPWPQYFDFFCNSTSKVINIVLPLLSN